LLCAVTALFSWLGRSRPHLLIGWLLFVGMLVPVIGLVQVGVQARADRYMYLPQVGLAIALAWGLADLARTRAQRRALAAAGAGAVLALGAAAFVQVGYWRDSLALFERGLEIAPGSDTFHAQLGAVHLRADRFERAEHHYREAYRLNPAAGRAKLVRFQLGMGKLLEARGEPAAAALRYADALGLDPTSRRASASLHRAIGLAGRSSEARAWIARSVRGTPGDARLHEALGFAALVDGQHAEAVAQSREALRVDPALSAARNNLAWLLATAPDPSLRDPAEALRVAEELVAESDAPSAQLLDTLAATQAAAGRAEAAVQTAQRAIDVALRAQAGELALAIRARLAHYRAGRPWIEPAASPESAD
jgi:Flp pilus assembly protein TadD